MNNQYLIEKFNKDFPVGSKVMWRITPDAEYKEFTVKNEAFFHHGDPVTFFKENEWYNSIHPEFVKYELNKEVEEAIKVFLPENMPAEITRLTLENERLKSELAEAKSGIKGREWRIRKMNEYIGQLENQRDSERQQHKEQMEQLAKNLREINHPELGNIENNA